MPGEAATAKSINVRRAAAHPNRPGARCKAARGEFAPAVDHGRRQGTGARVEICPYNVFEIGLLEKIDYDRLSWTARLKVKVHGMQIAYKPRADRCLACSLCMVVCPEGAPRLVASHGR